MAVKLFQHPLPTMALGLVLALPAVHGASAQTTYVGGGSVIVNMQALDRLGPPLPGFANNQDPGSSALGGPAQKPLLGDSGPAPASVKLRPPRATKSAAAPATAAAVAKAPTPAAAPATTTPRRTGGSRGEGTSPAPQTPAVVVNLPPPVTDTPSSNAASNAGRPLQLPAPPSAVAAAPSPVPAPAPAPAAVAQAPVIQAPAAPAPAAPRAANPAAQQSALLTPPPVSSAAPSAGQVNLTFEAGKSDLSGEGSGALEALARALANTEDRIQIRAYASASGADAASGARRLSLSRALAVRGFLIDRGIRSTRIDVRALGAPSDNSPPDRVEVAPVGR